MKLLSLLKIMLGMRINVRSLQKIFYLYRRGPSLIRSLGILYRLTMYDPVLFGNFRDLVISRNNTEQINADNVANKNLLSKVGDLSIRVDILKDAVDIAQKKAILKALQSPKNQNV